MFLYKCLFTCMNLTIASYIMLVFIEKTRTKIKEKKFRKYQDENIYINVESFTNKNALCRKHMVKGFPCSALHCSHYKLQKLINLIDNAKTNLDICIYLLTCKDLAYAVLRAYKRKINVRVIVEKDMAGSTSSKAKWLMEQGILVRSKALSTLMHHKYCVIDANIKDKGILITGSLNWTLQALAGNWESIIITNHPILVREFYNEFNEIWDYFKS